VGNEVFFAGHRQATMTGGGGADVFAFAQVRPGQAGGQVTMSDFNQAPGQHQGFWRVDRACPVGRHGRHLLERNLPEPRRIHLATASQLAR
jgi:hypothetical protein